MANREAERAAIRRVLGMVDKWCAPMNQHELHAVGTGLMTVAEIRKHVRAAKRLGVIAGKKRGGK